MSETALHWKKHVTVRSLHLQKDTHSVLDTTFFFYLFFFSFLFPLQENNGTIKDTQKLLEAFKSFS